MSKGAARSGGRPGSEGIKVLGSLVLGALVLLAVWWAVGRAIEGAPSSFEEAFDLPGIEYAADRRTPLLTTAMDIATHLGGTLEVIVLLVAATLGSWIVTRSPRWPVFFACAVVALQLSSTLKVLVDRARPTLSPLHDVGSKAWPSGHATASAVAFGALGYFLFRVLPKPWSILALVACGLVIVVVGVTRVYLGVHWPTDVIGGWALGLVWVTAVTWATRPLDAGGGRE